MTGPVELPRLPPAGSREHDLVVIGDTGVDFVAQVKEHPQRDSKTIGQHVGIFGGGMGANFAAAAGAAHRADDVVLVSRVGDDVLGAACLSDLAARGLDVGRVAIEPDGVTWWCAVALDPCGEKALLGGRTSASLPHVGDMDVGASARWVHVLADVESAEAVLGAARAHGAVASVDIEASFAHARYDDALALVGAADMVITNAAGLRLLAGDDDLQAAALAVARQTHVLLATLGASGSVVATPDDALLWEPAPVVPRVVDTTGAGDSFAGTFVGRVLAGDDTRAALTSATAAAGETVTRFGARDGPLALSTVTMPAPDAAQEESV